MIECIIMCVRGGGGGREEEGRILPAGTSTW